MSSTRVIARNISANYLGSGIQTLILLALTPFVIHHLGTVGYAVWILIQTLSFYLKFLDFGLYSAMVKYLAGHVAAGQQKEVNNLGAGVLGGFLIAGFAALGLSMVIAEFLVPLFHQVPAELVPQFKSAIILFGINMLISFPGLAANGIYEGYQRYDLFNCMAIAVRLLKGLGTVVLLLLGCGILQLAMLEIVISIITVIANLLIIKRLFPEITWSVKFFQRSGLRLRQYRLWASLNKILVEGGGQLDTLLLPLFLSVALLTPYTIICSMAAILLVIIEPLTKVLFPMSSAQEAKRNHEGIQRALILATKAGFAISLPVAIVLASMGDFLIDLWIGSEYVQPPSGLLPIVLSSFLVTVFFMPATSMLQGMAKQKGIFIFSTMETVLAIFLISVSVRQHELIGLAASCAFANCVISFGCLLPFASRHLQVPMRTFLLEGLIRPLLPGYPALMTAYILVGKRPPENWWFLAAYASIVAAVYLIGFYLISISRADRAFLVHRLKQLLAGAPLSLQGRAEK